MKTILPSLQAHLDSGETTLCHCWRLTLKSAETLGFTDHDQSLTFEGTIFEAQAGFTASEMEQGIGLSVDNLDVDGALTSGKLDAARLTRGDFDHATFEIWRVNWADVAQRVLLREGHLGEVTHDGTGFTVELRGLTHLLSQERGRLFSFACDAAVGDARCGVNLDTTTFSVTTTVTAIGDAQITVAGTTAYQVDWFTGGTVTVGSQSLSIRRYHRLTSAAVIELWQAVPADWTVGATVTLRAGCDKRFTTCKSKFSNALNFRGFPHMPTNDFVVRFARDSDANDGAALVK
jgi:uncharacterized phage protein (TIGR02218 family)